LLEIQRQGSFATVAGDKHCRELTIAASATNDISIGRFDFDNACTLIGEQGSADRTRHHRGQIDDPDAR
jgi:hypothetical protein